MNIREMKIFKSVYETTSMTASATKLYISQPAISKTIADVEKKLGYELFSRKNGKLKRTKKSDTFYDQVCIILNEIEKLESLESKEKAVRLVSSITIANTSLATIINEFKHDLKVSVVNADELVKMIKTKKSDLGIVEGTYFDKELISKTIGVVPLAFFVRKDSKINIDSLEELLKHPILLREKGSSIRKSFDELLRNNSLSYEESFESVNSEAIMQSMKTLNKDCISLLPRPLINEEDFKILDLKGIRLETPIQLIYRKDKPLEDKEYELMDTLRINIQ